MKFNYDIRKKITCSYTDFDKKPIIRYHIPMFHMSIFICYHAMLI